MSPSAARARIAALPWRAVLDTEHDDLVTAKGSPITWRPVSRRPVPKTAPKTTTKQPNNHKGNP